MFLLITRIASRSARLLRRIPQISTRPVQLSRHPSIRRHTLMSRTTKNRRQVPPNELHRRGRSGRVHAITSEPARRDRL